ncbi:ArdC family protein [Sphingomonas immobilis]|uniref:Zincin-like metallopeptidase domain-containing protein n=1 Tax=Sphingomonas immobilis TaxID=3063997 RepID=A0ABT9A172_9SPHN|nr:zincin-like metallopeptidase domain-containing protein [Sphingomonas sp. CA1-15]MDO7843584.1 zincin-like metallopeptidase domain-containing protein [Sphingomonas sp. CA1-15]
MGSTTTRRARGSRRSDHAAASSGHHPTREGQTPKDRIQCPTRKARARGDVGDRNGGDAVGADTRGDLYDTVTRRVVADLEAGRVPWVQPWGRVGGAAAGLPRNAATDRPYSGINILLLWGAVIEHGYPSQGWLTFRQALAAGGAVRKGEHGTTVVYADRFTPETEKARARERGDDARSIAFLKRFTVFNVAQIDGLPEALGTDAPPLPEREIVPVGEALIAASGIDFRIGGGDAYYAPGPDLVQVPPQPAFFDQINYYRTACHELCHATGHKMRLDRNLTAKFGTKDYAREELVAEMGAAFVCAALGIVPTVRHADYLGSWLAVLKEDSRAIFRAASAASKAADWLLSRLRAAPNSADAIDAAAADPGEIAA